MSTLYVSPTVPRPSIGLSSRTRPAVLAPTRLRLPDLLHATDHCAAEVLTGRYDRLLPADGVPLDERWYTRLYGDDELDIWLISWVPGHSTELHDHGGSLGALTVVSGALSETRWDGRGLRRRTLESGDQAGFPLGWVHDVVLEPGRQVSTASPTLSVHAYSPPLTAMSYYDVTERDTLRRVRTELTDTPEGD
ncbi:cysteine dioxygenase family protein [Mycobacterium sp. OTB74]|jgi:hypothetical protein|uniref:cysteine dioxygenase n=1 Tax=Mycobacterium sp. OTB74 TaxID=1853452 RepID=UPI002476D953|nr:cysteine dioxygenase family protein [Mycobacterium sp. OTB74]MDH6247108.1 putative RmlC-like cupin family protein [Mycobacterium sp. OTB74]